jgi:hypothetical protein
LSFFMVAGGIALIIYHYKVEKHKS